MKVESMPYHDPFEVISSAVNLDDPAQYERAERFMVNALARVMTCLPVIAQSAALTAEKYLEGAATADEVLAARVALWESIRGRDGSDEPDVLQIRTVICALYGMDIEAPYDKLEYFLMFWEHSGLSMAELAGAIFDTYEVVFHAPSSA